MSRFLLDSDTITFAQFNHPTVTAHLASLPDADIALPVIAVQEQMRGWLARLPRLKSTQQEADWYDRLVIDYFPFWKKYQMVSFTQAAILRFKHLRSLKLNIVMMDLRIGAIALEIGSTVVTHNTADFSRVPGLSIVDWTV